nr:S49 family peptidase [Geodermatophilaceae bacterium]
WLDRVYADFTDKVAQARGLGAERVHELARGRVWTGADAHERGLVDALGGLRRAVEVAASLASVDADRVRLRRLPSVSPVDRLRPARSSEDRRAAASASALSGLLGDGSVAALAARFGLPAGGALLLPYQLRIT